MYIFIYQNKKDDQFSVGAENIRDAKAVAVHLVNNPDEWSLRQILTVHGEVFYDRIIHDGNIPSCLFIEHPPPKIAYVLRYSDGRYVAVDRYGRVYKTYSIMNAADFSKEGAENFRRRCPKHKVVVRKISIIEEEA